MKINAGLAGVSSPQERLFACPADTFYFDGTRHGQKKWRKPLARLPG